MMAQWRIKEISDLTGVSVRMLRHYDKIGLLKPSLRSENNYRWYAETDLSKLQQIVALKFLGFELKQIKAILQRNMGITTHLQTQQKIIKEQVARLRTVEQAIEQTLQRIGTSDVPDWNDLLLLIERYRMMENLKNSWAGKIFDEEQLKTVAQVRQQLNEEQLYQYQNRWKKLIKKVESNLDQDPKGPIGKQLGKAWIALIDELWKAHPEIKEATDKAYKEGKIENSPCSKEVAEWIGIACQAHGLLGQKDE